MSMPLDAAPEELPILSGPDHKTWLFRRPGGTLYVTIDNKGGDTECLWYPDVPPHDCFHNCSTENPPDHLAGVEVPYDDVAHLIPDNLYS